MKTGPFIFIGLLVVSSVLAQKPSEDGKPHERSSNSTAGYLSLEKFQALPSNPADYRIAYGKDKDQFGDLRVPSGAGPHPVAILIHGGCWKSDFATLRDLAPMADALKAEGVATWNIEYRRLSQAGSGWPGTFLDASKGVDYLRSVPADKKLDLTRVIVIGHSAGGHLAMWVAARSRLPNGSALYVKDPLPIRGVIDLAETGDMEAFIPFEQQGCRGAVVEEMLGGKPIDVPERYAQASAIKMLPLGIPQILVWGRNDDIAPIWLGERYTQAAKQAGDPVRLISIPDVGHFEIASPLSTTWPAVRSEIVALLAKRPDELSRTGENHKLLAKLAGTWAYTGKHFPAHAAPSAKIPEFKGTLVRSEIWEGRYFISETTGEKLSMPWADGREVVYKDMMMEGYDNGKMKFVRAIIDNHFDTGILLFEGTYDPATQLFQGNRERLRAENQTADSCHAPRYRSLHRGGVLQ
jgi:acetyl esterase/lipase